MDIQAIIAQVSAALADAPEKLQELVSDPKGTIEGITGVELGEGEHSPPAPVGAGGECRFI